MLNDAIVQILPVLGAVRSGNIENKRLLQLGAVNLVNLWPSHQFVRRKRLDQLPAIEITNSVHTCTAEASRDSFRSGCGE